MTTLRPNISNQLLPVRDLKTVFSASEDIEDAATVDEIITGLQLRNVSIMASSITKSDFSLVSLEKFDIANCEIKSTNFSGSKFPDSSWRTIRIDTCRLSGTQLQNSTIKNVHCLRSKLEIVNFRSCLVENCIFEDCVLDDVDFYGAALKNVEFVNCQISQITFASAKMKNVDISGSSIETIRGIDSLKGATINYDQLIQLAPYFAEKAGIKIK